MSANNMQQFYHKWSPTLGELEDTAENIWGTKPYDMREHRDRPCVFFGLYGLPDWYSLWNHRGDNYVLWAGSDIDHFNAGYWLDGEGGIKIHPKDLAIWLNTHCENWVENEEEQARLMKWGIESKIGQSFLGDVNKYPIMFKGANKRPFVYLSVSGANFDMYGWPLVEEIADKCEVEFYLYGSDNWTSKHNNVHVMGRIPKEQMNTQISKMDSGLRLNEKDGFSEVLAKSVLWGQYPITRKKFGYPLIDAFDTHKELINLLNNLKNKKMPNSEAREYYKTNLNPFPWNMRRNPQEL